MSSKVAKGGGKGRSKAAAPGQTGADTNKPATPPQSTNVQATDTSGPVSEYAQPGNDVDKSAHTSTPNCPLLYNGREMPTIPADAVQPQNNTLELTAWAYAKIAGFWGGRSLDIAYEKKEIARFLQLRTKTKITANGMNTWIESFAAVRSATAARGTYADAFAIYLFGVEREGDQMCEKCARKLGKFPKCVVLDEFGPTCACCQYQGSNVCSLIPVVTNKKKRKATDQHVSSVANFDPNNLTFAQSARLNDFLQALGRIPPQHLRMVASVLNGIASQTDPTGVPSSAPTSPAFDEDE